MFAISLSFSLLVSSILLCLSSLSLFSASLKAVKARSPRLLGSSLLSLPPPSRVCHFSRRGCNTPEFQAVIKKQQSIVHAWTVTCFRMPKYLTKNSTVPPRWISPYIKPESKRFLSWDKRRGEMTSTGASIYLVLGYQKHASMFCMAM